MKKTKLIALALTVLFAIVGCSNPTYGSSDPGASNYNVEVSSVALQDGRIVECFMYKDIYAGGLDCDWVNASTSNSRENLDVLDLVEKSVPSQGPRRSITCITYKNHYVGGISCDWDRMS